MLSDIATFLNDPASDFWTLAAAVGVFWLVIVLAPLLRFRRRDGAKSEDTIRRFRLPARGGRAS
jgi:hypothetical protein